MMKNIADRLPGCKIVAALSTLLVASGCQSSGGASECDGWKRLTPSADTRSFIISQDRPFAEQIAAHNRFGSGRKCWK